MPGNESNQINVTIVISTKNRYFSTLPLTILSIANQTFITKELLIYDDNDSPLDLRNNPLYQYLFILLDQKGCEYRVIFGEKKGQVLNHHKSLNDSKWPLILRVDDDEILEPNVLEVLVTTMLENKEVGAVGGLILDPKSNYQKLSSLASNNIEDINLGLNIQWFKHENKDNKSVDHLYSSFLYRKDLAEYNSNLSQAGHREETLMTLGIKQKGYNLLVNPNAITWHFRFPEGGIRGINKEAFDHDEEIFKNQLNEYKINTKSYKLCILDNGLGDHLVFKKLIPELQNKYNNLIIACCYPLVFEEYKNIKIISISEAQLLTNINEHNIYKKMNEWQWKESIELAYKKLYLNE
ncbi:MAG: glycosyltransferase [Patescibacteria group bacterium]